MQRYNLQLAEQTLSRTAAHVVLGAAIGGAMSVFFVMSAAAATLPAQCPGTLADYNVIEGSSADETLKGTPGNDFIFGNGGSDTVYGLGGNDCILSDGGNDNIKTLDGDDVILVGGENNVINAGDGNNHVISGSGRDNITTGEGNDIIEAGDGNNAVRSNGGDDIITTGSGNDYINAGPGNDSCSAGGGNNILVNCVTVDETPDEPPVDDGNSDDTDGSDDDSSGNDSEGDETEDTNTDEDTTDDTSNDNTSDDDNNTGGDGGTAPPVGSQGGIALVIGGGVPPVTVNNESITAPQTGRVLVTWKTNIPATSQVVYGKTSNETVSNPPEYGYEQMTQEDMYLTTEHQMEIAGLEPGVTYYFRPVSDVGNSTEGTGGELTYAFDPEPVIVTASASDESSTISGAEEMIEVQNSGTVLRVNSPESPIELALAETENGELALLFGVLPIGAGQFMFILVLLLILAYAVWRYATKEKQEADQSSQQ